MKTISIKSPNLEYYLAVERCDKALLAFLKEYLALNKTNSPSFVKTLCITEFKFQMEEYLEDYLTVYDNE